MEHEQNGENSLRSVLFNGAEGQNVNLSHATKWNQASREVLAISTNIYLLALSGLTDLTQLPNMLATWFSNLIDVANDSNITNHITESVNSA